MSAAAATGTPQTDRPAGDWVHWLLDAARTRLGMEVAWVSLFTEGSQLITAATGDLDAMNVQEGMRAPLEGSYCVRVLSGQLPAVVTGAGRDPRTRDLEVTGELGIGSYVGAPVRGPDARPIGMLCCLSRDAGAQLDGESVRTVELLADLISDHFRQAGAGTAPDLAARRARVRAFLAQGAVEVHLQPVVELTTGRTAGYEALSRFPGWGGDGPAALFAEAAAVGVGVELEEAALRATLAGAGRLPDGLTLAVNLSPDALLCPTVVDALLEHAGCPLAVEITEHSRVDDYEAVVAVTRGLRRAGVAVSVDDAGAGYASLRHILRLDPDVIKLDIGLVVGLHTDPARQAMTSAMVAFADETGARLVAEGVEHTEERNVLVARGVRYGQGYLLGRPRPAAEVLGGSPA
ncbi:EAL domain-containing protein [Blastococcus sp. MG754426]|uniref:sensor domain-containing phosphodiesterase n=1 Tax=unclassified Blastococcus TaxID=2619396 RepID=UPI001EF04742|nr:MULTISPECIES: EAL domain-containing protein [unclassified Blastococcus]MCF6505943.1 EAL domain-containing protein [Blastococcus sp. MG754426]MCF6510670.1 EAL domain-containing protein [Blastococcus sp. MG754427]